MISGFFNSPTAVARSVLLQRNTPREMRGRVFSAFYVSRDVIFLFGMAGAGLADIINVRLLIVVRLGPLDRRRPASRLSHRASAFASLRAARAPARRQWSGA